MATNYEEESRKIIIYELMSLISDIKNGATINKFKLYRDTQGYVLNANITPKQLPGYKYISKTRNKPITVTKPKSYDCHQCRYHGYDTLFGGDDEYEICDKGHDLFPEQCDDFEEH